MAFKDPDNLDTVACREIEHYITTWIALGSAREDSQVGCEVGTSSAHLWLRGVEFAPFANRP